MRVRIPSIGTGVISADHAFLELIAGTGITFSETEKTTNDDAASVTISAAASTDFSTGYGNLVTPFSPVLISSTAAVVANTATGVRCIIPKTGTLTDIAVYIASASGNIDVGVYDTNSDAARTKLYSSGSVAMPAGPGWKVVATAALSVTQGQAVDMVFAADNATATFGRYPTVALGNNLPSGFLPVTGGATAWLAWKQSTSFPLPSTIAVNTGTADVIPTIARIV